MFSSTDRVHVHGAGERGRPSPGAPLVPILFLAGSLVLPGSGRAQDVAHPLSCPDPAGTIGDLSVPLAHVRYLADDALEGREVASPGARCAAEYIAGYLQSVGLNPAGRDGSYYQTFSVRMGSRLGAPNRLELGGESFEAGSGWSPYGFSASGDVEAPLVYVGPGVSRPGEEEDAFAHLDVEGKIVVVEGSGPGEGSGDGFSTDPHFKASVAAGRGAAAVLVLLPEGMALPELDREMRPSVRVPAVALLEPLAGRIRTAAEAGETLRLTTTVEPLMREARNVVAVLPGADPVLQDEVVIVGAHYDHLGLGGSGSLAPDEYGVVHNGADDNASGTAALLEVARRLASASEVPARTVLFIAFTGEEKGLWGSGRYVEDPILPLEKTVAMINMDMVGRLRDNTLTVYGVGTAEEWPDFLERLNERQAEPFQISEIPDGFGPSDQSSFYGKGIPVLHFFTNTHTEYHRPEDDWQLIDARGLERVVALVTDVVAALAGTPGGEVMALTPVEGAGNPHAGATPGEEEAPGPGYGPYLGTIPDMTPQDFGVRITGVRKESPAEKAGLRGGDVIVEFGGEEIADLYALTYALRDHRPGDRVEIVVLRDGERITLTAVLGRRR